jgi:uncharacterized protein YlxP (DUF503 family)
MIPGALTLKDRRAVIRSILERLKGRFNLSVSDLDGGERGTATAALGMAAVSNERAHAASVIQQALDFISEDDRVECTDTSVTEV